MFVFLFNFKMIHIQLSSYIIYNHALEYRLKVNLTLDQHVMRNQLN